MGQPASSFRGAIGSARRAHSAFLAPDWVGRAELGPAYPPKVDSEAVCSPLSASWVSANVAFLKEMDFIGTKLAPSGPKPPEIRKETDDAGSADKPLLDALVVGRRPRTSHDGGLSFGACGRFYEV